MKPDTEAEFREYVSAKRFPFRRFAYLVCGDWHRAEDVVQVVFIKLYSKWTRWNDVSSVDPYARRMIVNALNDIHRRSWFKRERSRGELPEPAVNATATADDRRDLLTALATLPIRRRAVLVLRFWEDKSVEETAQILNCSPSTVKSQAARGLATMRGLLSESAITPVEGKVR